VTLFCDRNLGRRVPDALKLLGLPVEKHDDHFPQDEKDETLLRELGKRQWVMVTGDEKLTRNQSALTALSDHRARCFVLAGAGHRPRWYAVRIIARNWDRIEELVADEPPPFLCKLYLQYAAKRVELPA
jgi:hypothetical protein